MTLLNHQLIYPLLEVVNLVDVVSLEVEDRVEMAMGDLVHLLGVAEIFPPPLKHLNKSSLAQLVKCATSRVTLPFNEDIALTIHTSSRLLLPSQQTTLLLVPFLMTHGTQILSLLTT